MLSFGKYERSVFTMKIKRLISLTLWVSLLFSVFSITVFADNIVLGDLDADGSVTAADARICLRASAKLVSLSEKQQEAANVLTDDEISAASARAILRYSAKLIKLFPVEAKDSAVWEKDNMGKEPYPLNITFDGFDIQNVLGGLDSEKDFLFDICVFKGKIIDAQEYTVSWTDTQGNPSDKFSKALLTVEIQNIYNNFDYSKGDIVKVYCPNSLYAVIDNSAVIKEKREYIFITRILNEKYIEYENKYTPEFYGNPAKYADFCLTDTYYSLLPAEENAVLLYSGYFKDDSEVLSKVLNPDEINTDLLTDKNMLSSGYFIALSQDDFSAPFSDLIFNLFIKLHL